MIGKRRKKLAVPKPRQLSKQLGAESKPIHSMGGGPAQNQSKKVHVRFSSLFETEMQDAEKGISHDEEQNRLP